MFKYKLSEEVISKYIDRQESSVERIRIINHLRHDPDTFTELFHTLEIHDMTLINNSIYQTRSGNSQIINRARAEQVILLRFGLCVPFHLLLADIRRENTQNPSVNEQVGQISEQYGLRVTRKNPATLKDLRPFVSAHKEIIIGIDQKEVKSKAFYNNIFHSSAKDNIPLPGEPGFRYETPNHPILIERDTGQICETCSIGQFFNIWPGNSTFSLTVIEKN